MAKFEFVIPNELFKDIKTIHDNADNIFKDMTRAGAKVVKKRMELTCPKSWKNSAIMGCLQMTKSYQTKDSIATAVKFYDYFINENGVKTPAPLVVNVTEFGSSRGHKKHPFVRKSFNKEEIEQAMLEAQKKASGGLLE